MPTLSEQLRGITNQIQAGAEQQQAAGQAGIGTQFQQALSGAAPTAAKTAAQQITPQMQQAAGQLQQQVAGAQQQQLQAAGQQAIQQQGFQGQMALQQQARLDEQQIERMQRQGRLRQNSAELEQAKRLQTRELQQQQQIQQTGIEFDNTLSFMTRSQREDLAKMGGLAKQQIFDSRLQFAQDEQGRKFTNSRQLADYAVASAVSTQQLRERMRDMQQAFDKEMITLEAAHRILDQRLRKEFERAEAQKNYAVLEEIQARKQALEKKMARKAAQASAVTNILVGAGTIAGGVLGSMSPVPGATVVGAQLGAGLGQATAGAVT